MSDFVAWLAAFFLLFIALVLSTSLRRYRIKREEMISQETSRGRQIIAELPIGQGFVLFTEDSDHFYYGEQRMNKLSIQVARILINGSPIASYVVQGVPLPINDQYPMFEDQPEGIARDRWDVLIKTSSKPSRKLSKQEAEKRQDLLNVEFSSTIRPQVLHFLH